MPSIAVKPRRRVARVAVAMVAAVLVAGVVLYGAVVYPLLDSRAVERCSQAALAAEGDATGVNVESWLPPRWTCTVTDAEGRSRVVEYDLGRLLD